MDSTGYYERLAAAYVRGYSLRTGRPKLPEKWKRGEWAALEENAVHDIIKAGKDADLKLYRFKATHGDMPRIKRVMGFLKSISFESLLDVGSGRGVFLFPFLTEFPWVRVTALDILPYRVEFLQDMAVGGVENLTASRADICDMPFSEKSVDVVSMLEVLEHIPDVGAAVRSAVRIARKFVVLTVPSKEDDNPEHIHLLTKERLNGLFAAAGCTKLHFDGVNGHLMAVANVRDVQGGESYGDRL